MKRIVAYGGAAFLLSSLFLFAPASSAPGDPGEPADPVVVYTEDFENEAAGSNVQLSDYDSANPGITYSAETPWDSRVSCNGLVIDWSSTQTLDGDGNPVDCVGANGAQAPGTVWFSLLQRLIYAQGVIGGMDDPTANAGVASFTSNPNPGANRIQFQTDQDIQMASTGRFVTFSVDATAMSCQSTHPLLRFYVRDSEGTEIPVSPTAIDPCTGGVIDVPAKNGFSGAVRGGRFIAPGSVFVPGDTVGIVLRNQNGSAGGNDGAYDNIRLLDATPQLDKSFETRDRPWIVGDAADLTFTVTNTSELAEKAGWDFTDNLPEGLEVAGEASTTCAAGEITAADGATSIAVENGTIAADDASCTITVPVTATGAGTFVNGPGNVTTSGLDEPGSSTIVYEVPDPRLTLVKTAELDDANDNGVADEGETIAYSFHAENTGNMPLDDVSVDDEMLADAGVAITPASVDLAIDAEADFTADPYVVTAEDVQGGDIDNVATATGTTPGGDDVTSDEATTSTPTPTSDDETGSGDGGAGGGSTDGLLPDTGSPATLGLLGAALAAIAAGALLVRRKRAQGRHLLEG